jgi:FlaA1/EpsC-like NDP-sugar epimerase
MSLNSLRSFWWAWTAIRQLSIVATSFWIAYLLRFDFVIPSSERHIFYAGLLITVSVKMLFCLLTGLELERLWPYQGFSELVRLLTTNVAWSVVSSLSIYAILGHEFPRSVYCLDLLVCVVLSGGARFGARFYREVRTGWKQAPGQKKLLIYGAGVAGITLLREIRNNPALGFQVIGFLDDDPRKKGAKLAGVPVLGSGDSAARVVENYKKRGEEIREIVVAMPSASGRHIRAAVANGRAAGVPCRIVPGLGELISGKLAVGAMREISVTDLLGREPVALDMESVRRAIFGRVVLVTGAAGSIGSELCNQLAQYMPDRLIAFDQAESQLFFLEAELRKKYPALSIVVEVGDIRHPLQVGQVIEEYKVDSVFHAAAYKHVPLMERQICEAVRNNVIGTWNLAQAAWRGGVSSFLLISTDKAVNPSSIMGLTKRVAELIVSAHRSSGARGTPTRFVSVRFGNVLVSNGSVVPIFEKQIAAGGPVTVTHPDMCRYFMTVQEAVQLVLKAGTMGQGSEIFVLDMGTPVKIVDLARNMITLAGFVPNEDIEIAFTGPRPGEKIFEELSLADENTVPTTHPEIRVFKGRQITFHELNPWISELQHLLWRRDSAAIIAHMSTLVPEYRGNKEKPALAEASVTRSGSAVPATEVSTTAQVFGAAAG